MGVINRGKVEKIFQTAGENFNRTLKGPIDRWRLELATSAISPPPVFYLRGRLADWHKSQGQSASNGLPKGT